MKKTSPIVLALLFSMAGAVKLGENQHAHQASFLNSHDYDVFPNTTPKIAPSPVKTSIKGKGCNADACPSTGPSCCMVSPDRNMTPAALGRSLSQKSDDKKVEEKPAE